MNNVFSETTSLCPVCAKDTSAFYEERQDGMFLHVECNEHGRSCEKVENDSGFFKQVYGLEYKNDCNHLALPITYQCNQKCTYCYSMSNSSLPLPEDRPFDKLVDIMKNFDGSKTLIGGEPTVRKDLLQLIRAAKEMDSKRKISLATNGQRLRDIEFVRELKDSGLDFVFLSHNDIEYEESKVSLQNKMAALENCKKQELPVYLQRTIDNLNQMDSILDVLETYKRVIFKTIIRSVKPYGINYPSSQIFMSDMIKQFKKEEDNNKGMTPFHRNIRLNGKNIVLCSWINDMKRYDPIDRKYIVSNDMLTTFQRGIRLDEVLLSRRDLQKYNSPPSRNNYARVLNS